MFVYLSYVTYYKQFHVLSQQANSIVSATIEATLDKLPGQSRAIPCLTFSNQVYTISHYLRISAPGPPIPLATFSQPCSGCSYAEYLVNCKGHGVPPHPTQVPLRILDVVPCVQPPPVIDEDDGPLWKSLCSKVQCRVASRFGALQSLFQLFERGRRSLVQGCQEIFPEAHHGEPALVVGH